MQTSISIKQIKWHTHMALKVAKVASGFTLVECMVAVLVVTIVLVSLYACFTSGFSMQKVTRENLRATQIILQRMEAIRLSSYDLVANPAYYPTTTTNYYDEKNQASGNGGAAYTVTFSAIPGPADLPPTYKFNVMLVTVTASWTSDNVSRSRSMKTYVARSGIQNYVAGY